MSKVYDFLTNCKSFFVLTVNGNAPAGRPFGAVMEKDGDLFIATSNKKEVYKQLVSNKNVQIVAQKPDSREWVRVTGIAKECKDTVTKKQMLEACPILFKHYENEYEEKYSVFKITNVTSEFN